MSTAYVYEDDLGPAPAFLSQGRETGPAAARERRPHLVEPDFRPKAIACERGDGKCKYSEGYCDSRQKCLDVQITVPDLDLAKLEAELGRNRLDEIATLVRALTYGEMMTFAAGIWYARKDEEELTDANLPDVLHRWATTPALSGKEE